MIELSRPRQIPKKMIMVVVPALAQPSGRSQAFHKDDIAEFVRALIIPMAFLVTACVILCQVGLRPVRSCAPERMSCK